jgi:3-hydroxyacyl-CoA dehydrogenase/enoyl-CoA hydratase/3-hydroxybutyryl-CoA epimerase
MTAHGYSLVVDEARIATVGFDLPGKVNIMDDAFMEVMPRLIDELEAMRGDLHGVILTSRKSTFFAGGDLALMRRAEKGQEQFLFTHFERLKSFFRRLERLERPLVAAINGTALGGGYELCLACHRRIALESAKTRIGLPEVNFGILPAAGGVIRLTAILGLLPALDFLVTGRAVDVAAAHMSGLIDEVVETEPALMERAKAWILSNAGIRHAWDRPRELGAHRLSAENRMAIFQVAPWLRKSAGQPSQAAVRIADIAAQSIYLDFDTASRIETRGFVELVLTREANKRISAFFETNSRQQRA